MHLTCQVLEKLLAASGVNPSSEITAGAGLLNLEPLGLAPVRKPKEVSAMLAKAGAVS